MNNDSPIQKAIDLHHQKTYQYFNIDRSWVTTVASSEAMTAQFLREDGIHITLIALEELMKVQFPRMAFRILTDESKENFIVATLAFVDRMDVPENSSTQEVLASQLSNLIGFCAIFIAAASKDGKSQEVLDRIARRLPDHEKAQEMFKNVDFSENKVDWTQHVIDNIEQYAVPKNTIH